MAHTPTGIKGMCNRYQYDDEKRDGYEKHEAALQQVLNPPEPNVVPLRRRTAAAE